MKVEHVRVFGLNEIMPSPENAQLYKPVTPDDEATIELAESIREHGINNERNKPAMRENQTPEPTDDQYGLFTKEECDTLILRACKHGATEEETATFLAWANKAKINAALLDLIQRGDLEISGYKDDGAFVVNVPDSQGSAPTP
jgi:hypothetical protein